MQHLDIGLSTRTIIGTLFGILLLEKLDTFEWFFLPSLISLGPSSISVEYIWKSEVRGLRFP